MTKDCYQEQIKRMVETWGERSYLSPRIALFWRAFQETSNDVFVTAVDELIANSRKPPMLQELSAAVEQAKLKLYRHHQMPNSGIFDIMENAARNNKVADPEFVSKCLEIARDRINYKMTKEQFAQACDYLDTIVKHNLKVN